MCSRLVSTIIALSCLSQSLFAQSPREDFAATNPPPSTESVYSADIVSFGLSYAITDIAPFAYLLMPSTAYAHKFSEAVELEIAAHFVSMAFSEQSTSYTFVSGATPSLQVEAIRYSTYGVMGDIATIISPFSGGWRQLRLGIGVSMRLAGRMSSEDVTYAFNNQQNYQLLFTKHISLGGNARIEYVVPLWENAEIAVRAYTNIYAQPIQIVGNRIPIGYILEPNLHIYPNGGTISLGAFLRISF